MNRVIQAMTGDNEHNTPDKFEGVVYENKNIL